MCIKALCCSAFWSTVKRKHMLSNCCHLTVLWNTTSWYTESKHLTFSVSITQIFQGVALIAFTLQKHCSSGVANWLRDSENIKHMWLHKCSGVFSCEGQGVPMYEARVYVQTFSHKGHDGISSCLLCISPAVSICVNWLRLVTCGIKLRDGSR